MKYVVALVVALVLNAGANLLMKVGARSVSDGGGLLRDGPVAAVRIVLSNTTLMGGLCCFAFNVMLYMYALQSKSLKISIAYPIMVGGGYALIAIVARFHPALGERLTVTQMVGVGFVLMGIVLIASGGRTEAG